MELRFQNLSVFRNEESVIKSVTGSVRQGEILLVVGHDNCGHSLLLSTLAGRCPLYEGDIFWNDSALSYSAIPGKVAYVTSLDLFLPTLTVYENLKYSGLLRLPQSVPEKEKSKIIQNIKNLTGLEDDAQTFTQIASRVTKKCLSIACELFQPAEVLVIDKPFSNLTYEESKRIVSVISKIATQLNKGIIVSMSVPDSHVVGHATKLICLSRGQVVFQGLPTSLGDYLDIAGFRCSKLQSQMELLMEVVLDPNHHHKLVTMAERLRMNDASNHLVWRQDSKIAVDTSHLSLQHAEFIRETFIGADFNQVNGDVHVHIESHSLLDISQSGTQTDGSSTSFCYQTSVLTARNFHSARRRILSPISLIQNGYILLLCVLVWWRPPRTEETIKDRMGLFFFTAVQWAFFSLLDAILSFPKEMQVIQKERKYKLYKISTLCVAKTMSEFPLAILQPCLYLAVIYWVASLNSATAFLGSLGVLVLNVIAAQGIGLFLGTALNPPWTLTVVPLGLLSMMLWGGAFNTPPKWMQWGKYASYFTYGLNAFISLEFKHADPIRCGAKSMVPMCNSVDPSSNVNITHFPSDAILIAQNITWSALDNSMVLIGLAIVTRVLWYIVLRNRK